MLKVNKKTRNKDDDGENWIDYRNIRERNRCCVIIFVEELQKKTLLHPHRIKDQTLTSKKHKGNKEKRGNKARKGYISLHTSLN